MQEKNTNDYLPCLDQYLKRPLPLNKDDYQLIAEACRWFANQDYQSKYVFYLKLVKATYLNDGMGRENPFLLLKQYFDSICPDGITITNEFLANEGIFRMKLGGG